MNNKELVSSTGATGYGSMTEDPAIIVDHQVSSTTTDKTTLQKRTELWSFLVGILYAIIIVCGITSEVGLRGNLVDYNDADTTISNIQESPAGLRWSLLLDLTMSVSDVALSILLGAVLVVNGADKLVAVIAMVFRIVQQAVLATNLLHLFVASILLDPSLACWDALAGIFDQVQAESLAMLFIYVHKYGYAVALVFFAISMVLLGGVIWQSRVYPRWIGAAIALAGVGYLLDSLSYFMVDSYTGDGTMNSIYMLPVFVAEFGFAGWLLFRKPVPAH